VGAAGVAVLGEHETRTSTTTAAVTRIDLTTATSDDRFPRLETFRERSARVGEAEIARVRPTNALPDLRRVVDEHG
jgi:hypothetical protein